ncbi:NUDIX hydrolase [Rossellomorea aquimaris]|uniref:NUDIX hydrolase n=1 Tax=Rossellomorea aquimaris TaxID=189382 RepID=UPI0007D069E3|nr:NUDIX hydrolase [Rossellomorea aquimaris]
MKEWLGAAAVCLNEQDEILVVRGYDSPGWEVPSGGIEIGETPEQCCEREVKEETGYDVKVVDHLHTKKTKIQEIKVTTYYFKTEVKGGSLGINDPDKTIAEAKWVSISEFLTLKHAYPEDTPYIEKWMKKLYRS